VKNLAHIPSVATLTACFNSFSLALQWAHVWSLGIYGFYRMDMIFDFLAQPLFHKTVGVWLFFLLFAGGLMAFDLGVMHKKSHEVDVKESLRMSAFYAFIAGLYGIWVWLKYGAESGANFYSGYLIEMSLSMDNLFVISIIFMHLGIPRKYQHRVLFWGIIGVIVLRGIMIVAGAALIEEFHWILYFFGAFLLYTGAKMLWSGHDDEDHNVEDQQIVRFLRKSMNLTQTIEGEKFFVKSFHAGKGRMALHATPLFLALCMVETADLVFAVDSIPAIFAITTDPFIVFTSNIFAVLGLRSLYFTLAALLHRFKYLKFSLALILILIGAKIFYHELFHGEPDSLITLVITLLLLVGGVVVSMLKTSAEKQESEPVSGESNHH
jgi:tellurite resistance protein TerC